MLFHIVHLLAFPALYLTFFPSSNSWTEFFSEWGFAIICHTVKYLLTGLGSRIKITKPRIVSYSTKDKGHSECFKDINIFNYHQKRKTPGAITNRILQIHLCVCSREIGSAWGNYNVLGIEIGWVTFKASVLTPTSSLALQRILCIDW